jgi:hypothetical protein
MLQESKETCLTLTFRPGTACGFGTDDSCAFFFRSVSRYPLYLSTHTTPCSLAGALIYVVTLSTASCFPSVCAFVIRHLISGTYVGQCMHVCRSLRSEFSGILEVKSHTPRGVRQEKALSQVSNHALSVDLNSFGRNAQHSQAGCN